MAEETNPKDLYTPNPPAKAPAQLGYVMPEWMKSREYKIGTAIPYHRSPFPPASVESSLRLKYPFGKHNRYIVKNIGISQARTISVSKAKQDEMTHLLFFDSDTVAPENGLMMLLEDDKDNDIDIISGLYFGRTSPHVPIMYKEALNKTSTNWKGEIKPTYLPVFDYPEGVIQVDAIGLGFALIKLSVFEKMDFPYFKDEFGITEDIIFSEDARAKGFNIWVDTRVKCGHITEAVVDEENFKACKPNMKTPYEYKNKEIIKR